MRWRFLKSDCPASRIPTEVRATPVSERRAATISRALMPGLTNGLISPFLASGSPGISGDTIPVPSGNGSCPRKVAEGRSPRLFLLLPLRLTGPFRGASRSHPPLRAEGGDLRHVTRHLECLVLRGALGEGGDQLRQVFLDEAGGELAR